MTCPIQDSLRIGSAPFRRRLVDVSRRILADRGFALVRIGNDQRAFAAGGWNAWRWASALRINTVFDIGANAGQFIEFALETLPESTIHAFEPMPECFAILCARYGGLPQVRLHCVALSDQDGTGTFYVSEHDPSSSLLESDTQMASTFPHNRTARTTTVHLARLDAFSEELRQDARLLVKLDVEGAELSVLRAGAEVLSQALAVVVEVAFLPLRKDQGHFADIHDSLRELGFRFSGVLGSQKLRRQDGLPLLADCLFLRT